MSPSAGDSEEWVLRVRRTGNGTGRELFDALARDGVVLGDGGVNLFNPRVLRIQVKGSPQVARQVLAAHGWTLESVQTFDDDEAPSSPTGRRRPAATVAAYLGAALALGVAARSANGWARALLAVCAAASAVAGAWIAVVLGALPALLWLRVEGVTRSACRSRSDLVGVKKPNEPLCENNRSARIGAWMGW